MKFSVNENCIGCGMCEGTCPLIFHLEDGKAQAEDREVNDEELSSALDAQSGCPVSAIETKD